MANDIVPIGDLVRAFHAAGITLAKTKGGVILPN
jgi:hypothetical protein